MIITVTLLALLFIASIIFVWLFRQRLARFLPRKETLTTTMLFAAVALLLVVVLLPDVLLLVYTLNIMPHSLRIVLALAAATMVCVGCYRQALLRLVEARAAERLALEALFDEHPQPVAGGRRRAVAVIQQAVRRDEGDLDWHYSLGGKDRRWYCPRKRESRQAAPSQETLQLITLSVKFFVRTLFSRPQDLSVMSLPLLVRSLYSLQITNFT